VDRPRSRDVRIALLNFGQQFSADASRLLASLLKGEGHEVRLVFLPKERRGVFRRERFVYEGYSAGEVEALLALLEDRDAVFASLLSTHSVRGLQLLRQLRTRFQGPLVLGGIHPTVCPEPSAQAAHWICRGEGEEAVLEIAQLLERGKSLETVENVGYWRRGRLHLNELRPLARDLDALPYSDYLLEDDWVLDNGRFARVTESLLVEKHVNWGFGLPTYCILASRGCPLHCTYCYNSAFLSTYGPGPLRFMSAERTVDEIEEALKNHPSLERVFFCDDDFFARPQENLKELCSLYKERVAVPFRCEASARTLTRDKLDCALEAGLRSVELGLQSGSERIRRDVYRRPETHKMLWEAAHLLHEATATHGLAIDYDVLVNNPYETVEERLETPLFLSRIPRPFRINVFSVIPFPGTEWREMLLRDGFIGEDPGAYNRNYIDLFHSDMRWTSLVLLCQSEAPWLLPGPVFRACMRIARRPWSDKIAGWIGRFLGRWGLPFFFELWTAKTYLAYRWRCRKRRLA